MSDTTTIEPRKPASLPFERIEAFRDSVSHPSIGLALAAVRDEAARFRKELIASGKPEWVQTFPLTALPYPAQFGLFRAAASPSPFVIITNRMTVVRWRDRGGSRRTLLFDPTDVELAANTPFFADLEKNSPRFLRPLFVKDHGSVTSHLAAIGISPGEVDYLSFDHLHTQDVRRWIGTTAPQSDISPNAPVEPFFPNAKLIVQRAELELLRHMHPIQAPWYQPATYRDLRSEAILEIEGSCMLGPGVALVFTPGHSAGNHTLALHTDTGIWALSENVVATECMTPEHSKIPGVRKSAARMGLEVVLNGNTLEETARQYNSVIVEKSIVDPSARDPRFLQFFPTSELTAHLACPGVAPTFVHGAIAHGRLVRET